MPSTGGIAACLRANGGWRNSEFGELAEVVIKGLHGIEDQVLAALLCYFSPLRDVVAAHHDEPLSSPDSVRHVLLEGTNGSAKTRLSKQLNRALLGPLLVAFYGACDRLEELKRSQGSPELSPSDLVGSDSLAVDEMGMQVLRFAPGPLLRNHLMFYADELNRSHPRTQSVLLEAMAEGQVTINTQDPACSRLRRLKDLFLVASQNPDRHIGTFALPEAQLDRFMVRLFMPFTIYGERIVADGAQLFDGGAVEDRAGHLAKVMKEGRIRGGRQTFAEVLFGVFQERAREMRLSLDEFTRRQSAFPMPAGLGPARDLLTSLEQQQRRLEWREVATAALLVSRFEALSAMDDASKFADALAKQIARRTPGSEQFQEAVEETFIDLRRRELRSMRIDVARLKLRDDVPKRAAALMYATWSERAAIETAEGLQLRVESNSRVQALVGELAHGSSIRGAEALRDLACAMAWARGDSEVTRNHVDQIAPLVLNHRVKLLTSRPQGWYTREMIEQLVGELVDPPNDVWPPSLGRGNS
jgi:MoxR-like ATPase